MKAAKQEKQPAAKVFTPAPGWRLGTPEEWEALAKRVCLGLHEIAPELALKAQEAQREQESA